jgi:hypothetical protein
MNSNEISKEVGHLGLVAAMMQRIGFSELIDECIPVEHNKGAVLSMGERVMGMIFNALGFLGFIDTRLYMTSQHFEDLAATHGRPEAAHFTDDSLDA